MTLNRLPDYLDHMRQAVADAQSFTEGIAQADFLQGKRTQQAVVMSLIVLGEAATKVMDQHPAFAEQHRHIPWRNMRGMRNRVAFILGFCCPVATVLVAACAYHLSARGTFHYALFKTPIRVS